MISNDTRRKVIENIRQTPKIGRVEEFGDLTSLLLSEKITGLLDKYFILIEVNLN